MQWRRPRFWLDTFRGFNYALTWQERRNLVLDRLEGSGFGWWIVFVAGLGFLTDAYDIFAINTVIPMLGTVYWGGHLPPRFQVALNVSTLLGSLVGQVLFGILADKYGRRKMYGLELVVTIAASLGFAAASPGVNNSMSMIAWLVFWRIIMGAGIGADYPLSAAITAEFAPTKYRARMLAAVFFFQPLGQLLATLAAFAATEGFRKHILHNQDPASCSINSSDLAGTNCARTVDQVWRLVSGLGAFPALLAIISRLTIPESVYWVLDVKNDSNQAMQTRDYWPKPSASNSGVDDSESIKAEDDFPDLVGKTADEESHLQREVESPRLSSGTGSYGPNDAVELGPPAQSLPLDLAPGAHHQALRMNDNQPEAKITKSYEDPHPREQSLKDFRDYLFGTEGNSANGNWTDLLATSMNWMLLDFTFYLLGVNSSRLIPNIFNEPSVEGPFFKLSNNEWHTLVATSIGAVTGGAVAIKIMHDFSRKKIQMWCFLALTILFVVVGILYVTLLGTKAAPAIVAVYVLCQLLFNVGPNTTTFIIPAEAFPTRYRCTCHGISAASGKLGSILGQIVITKLVDENDTHSKRVGYLLISFFLVMVVGAVITKFLTPETCDIWGKSRTLEELSFGKAWREELKKRDLETERNRKQRREAGDGGEGEK